MSASKSSPAPIGFARFEANARRRSGDGVVEAFDVEVDEVIRLLSCVFDLFADGRVA